MSFNKLEYIQEYNKKHYVQLKVEITKELKQELIDICNQQGISIRQFIINSIQRAKKNK